MREKVTISHSFSIPVNHLGYSLWVFLAGWGGYIIKDLTQSIFYIGRYNSALPSNAEWTRYA